MNGPTRCICGVPNLTENGHEFGCPLYIRAKQQDNRFYRVPEPDVSKPPAAVAGAPCTLADRVGTSAATTTSDYRRDITKALEVVRAGARRLHVLGWERSGNDLGRAAEAIESALSFLPLRASYDSFANDEAAKAIYDTWSGQPGWVPWVERGNSKMQEKARWESQP